MGPTTYKNSKLLVEEMEANSVIDEKVFGVYFGLLDSDSEIFFGGWNSKYVKSEDEITWTNLRDTNYWSVPIKKLRYNEEDIETETERGILDTGSSLVHFR